MCRLTVLAFFLPGFTETEAGGVGVKASISAAVIGLTTCLVTERQRATGRPFERVVSGIGLLHLASL